MEHPTVSQPAALVIEIDATKARVVERLLPAVVSVTAQASPRVG